MVSEKPRLEWKVEKFSSYSARAGYFDLSIFWGNTKGESGYKFTLPAMQSNKIFSDSNKAMIAAEKALEHICKKALKQLESKDQVLVTSKKRKI